MKNEKKKYSSFLIIKVQQILKRFGGTKLQQKPLISGECKLLVLSKCLVTQQFFIKTIHENPEYGTYLPHSGKKRIYDNWHSPRTKLTWIEVDLAMYVAAMAIVNFHVVIAPTCCSASLFLQRYSLEILNYLYPNPICIRIVRCMD